MARDADRPIAARAAARRRRAWRALEREIVGCRQCPRLVEHRERVALEKRRQYRDCDYWGKALPGFGDTDARLLIVGLAPAAHGANRTGRMFTGDRSGDWLYDALHCVGLANQPTSTGRDDGLVLTDAYVSAVARCAPPANKPTPDECERCRPYLIREVELLADLRVVLVLGQIAMQGFLTAWRDMGKPVPSPRPRFSHGGVSRLDSRTTLVTSYHPSQQNTFTGRLTRRMFRGVLRKAARLL